MAQSLQTIIKALEEYAAGLPESPDSTSAADEMRSFFSELREAAAEVRKANKAPYPDPEADKKEKKAKAVSDEPYPDEEELKQKAKKAVDKAEEDGLDKSELEAAIEKRFAPLATQMSELQAAIAELAKAAKAPYPAPDDEEEDDDEEEMPVKSKVRKGEEEPDVAELVKSQVAQHMRQIGFVPSAPALQRSAYGVEATSPFFSKSFQPMGDDPAQLGLTIEAMRKIKDLPYGAINRLRTQAGAW